MKNGTVRMEGSAQGTDDPTAKDAPPAWTAFAPAETAGQPLAAPELPPRSLPASSEVRPQTRRTRVTVRRVGPLSVLKFSLIFYFCIMLIFYFALLILYGVMNATGKTQKLADAIGKLGFQNPGPPFQIHGSWLFTRLFVLGCALTVLWSLINLFVAFLYNLISDVVGGVEITLAEKR